MKGAILGYIFYFILALVLAFFVANEINNMPVAKIDFITGECIRVENCDCDCDSLPEIYVTDFVPE